MPFHLLKPIQADDNLASLFNAYLRGLSTISIIAMPRETMHEFALEPHEDIDQEKRLYGLLVLHRSLRDLHHCILEAIRTLDDFFDTFHGDFVAYAAINRIQAVWQGFGEEDDWGLDDLPIYKEDEDSLHGYTVHADLQGYFPGSACAGEKIGTSGPEAYAAFSELVVHQTDFSIRKFFSEELGAEISIFKQDEVGSFSPLSLADQIEGEINEDLNNARLVQEFNSALIACWWSAEKFAAIGNAGNVNDPASLVHYEVLRNILNTLLYQTPRFPKPAGFGGFPA